MDPEDPRWQEILAGFGADADDVQLAIATAPEDSGLELRLVATSVAGADWRPRLQSLISRAETVGAVSFNEVQLGGKTVVRAASTGDPAIPTAYYYPSGDVMYTLVADEASAGEVFGQLPGGSSANILRAEEVATTQAPAQPSLLPIAVVDFPGPTYCIPNFGVLRVIALDMEFIHDPSAVITATSHAGSVEPAAFESGEFAAHYVEVWNGGREVIELTALSATTLDFGEGLIEHEIWHCLFGDWVDGSRILTVSHGLEQTHLTAEISSGTLVCGESGQAFSGTMNGNSNMFSGTDLKVCNPPDCVDAGILPKTTLRPYTAVVSDDGSLIAFEWEREEFNVDCQLTGIEKSYFSIASD